MPEKKKKCFTDRKDGRRIKDLDDMHVVIPYILPNRTDNEAVMGECIEIENALNYIKEKNEKLPDGEFKYTLFHLITAALAKTIYLRPKMNYFIQGHRFFERNEISFSFVIKKRFEDTSHEALAKVVAQKGLDTSIIDQIYGKIKEEVFSVRKKKATDETTKKMNKYKKLPRFLLKAVCSIVKFLDYHGWLPSSFTKYDPYFSSVFISNLGSIKLNANYHHLVNYGTNSIFLIIGEKKKCPIYIDDNNFVLKDCVSICFTIDERIADGVYFAKSIKLFKHIIANPSILDEKLETEVDCDLSLSNKL